TPEPRRTCFRSTLRLFNPHAHLPEAQGITSNGVLRSISATVPASQLQVGRTTPASTGDHMLAYVGNSVPANARSTCPRQQDNCANSGTADAHCIGSSPAHTARRQRRVVLRSAFSKPGCSGREPGTLQLI